jgi:hypothetical protein
MQRIMVRDLGYALKIWTMSKIRENEKGDSNQG